MCGIVGYIGGEEAAPILLDGLRRLEYRGYDSAGVAVWSPPEGVRIAKAKGRLEVLHSLLDGGAALPGRAGLGHTRWATHGQPSDVNSHPQTSVSGKIAVVHNGIIENYAQLKEFLIARGVAFASETDTEVIAHLLEYYYNGDILEATARVLRRLEGSYALGILCGDCPDRLVAARRDSPLIIGLGNGFQLLASDATALLPYTREVCYLEEGELAVLTEGGASFFDTELLPLEKARVHIDWELSAAEKGGYAHFMFKEIMEQPQAVRSTVSPRVRDGRVVLDGAGLTEEYLRAVRKIYVVACGSSYHVGMVAKYTFERLLRIPVEAALASEFRYCEPIAGPDTLVLAISQSGETADTIAALREAKRLGARTLSIVNVVGSTIAKESDGVLYTWAGPEIAVATTKAYSTQLSVIYLLALYMGELLGLLPREEYEAILSALLSLPDKMEAILCERESIQYYASLYFNNSSVFFIGRNVDYAVGLEGSLKLKEISYIHSEAYAAGELKHGTISLIEEGTLVVALAGCVPLFEKLMSNVVQVKSRGADVLGVAAACREGALRDTVDNAVIIPDIHPVLLPSLEIIPLQLFSYYVALLRGCDIDKPRNLAKSVTVE